MKKSACRCRYTAIIVALVTIGAAAPVLRAQTEDKVVRVDEATVRRMAKYKVDPEYPATARQFHMAGDVTEDVVIGTDGKVESVGGGTGNELLQAAVKAAVRRWIFPPYLVDGKPVKVRSTMKFSFHL